MGYQDEGLPYDDDNPYGQYGESPYGEADEYDDDDDYKYRSNKPNKSDGCFIATAAWGSPLAEEVTILKIYRDKFLLATTHGKLFVRTYYKYSPPIADIVRDNNLLKSLVRQLLKPIISYAKMRVRKYHLMENVGVACLSKKQV